MSRPTTPSVSVPTSTSHPLPLNTSAPARSTTAPAKSKHHIPHHPHRHHHHSRDKSVPQSAIQLSTKPFSQILSPIISNTGSKSDGINDASHSHHSRSSSAVAQEARAKKEEEEKRVKEGWRLVERKREGRKRFDEELRQTLSGLSALSTTTTRRLDYTYYSLLSHISALTATISDLRSLSFTTLTLQQTFSTESTEIAQEISHQISAFEDFDAQSKRIKALQARMEVGKKSVLALGGRLERVRSKVERFERVEEEWRERMSRRLRMLWGGIGTMVGLFVLLLVIRHWPRAREGLPPVARFGNMSIESVVGMNATLPVATSGPLRKEGRTLRDEVSSKTEVDLDDHPTLRLLDEL